MTSKLLKRFVLLLIVLFTTYGSYAQQADTLYLWPGKVPGEKEAKHKIIPHPDKGNSLIITDNNNPLILVFKPKTSKNNGHGIVVCPGGAYRLLAIQKEGYEIADWLTSLGYTVFVLEYRVPDKRQTALMDIQRAVRIVRSHADNWHINPNQITIMGFSAGASLCARASTMYDKKSYPEIDETDQVSCRPDFTMLIYPAYLDEGKHHSLTPELKVNKATPPMFIFQAADDEYANSSIIMTQALQHAGVPVEMHMVPYGGHGYGMRKGNPAAEAWPNYAAAWLEKVLK